MSFVSVFAKKSTDKAASEFAEERTKAKSSFATTFFLVKCDIGRLLKNEGDEGERIYIFHACLPCTCRDRMRCLSRQQGNRRCVHESGRQAICEASPISYVVFRKAKWRIAPSLFQDPHSSSIIERHLFSFEDVVLARMYILQVIAMMTNIAILI
jgi:hypothetical protein